MIAFLFWVHRHAELEEDRRAALAYQIEGALNRPEVADCLTQQLPLTGRNWQVLERSPEIWRRENAARHLRVDMVNLGDRYRIDVFTRDSRQLRPQEINAVKRCLSLPAT
ncbi:hypothetical protein ACKU27_22440 [Sphingobium yanoikuyae]|uniref:hypothetical protein n=1 Tax=Sphingobium yanoikuyae TaxID=13690 RepID=UPI002FDCA73F